jgi:hypothetical protein
LVHEKGFHLLLEAVPRILAEFPKRFVQCGIAEQKGVLVDDRCRAKLHIERGPVFKHAPDLEFQVYPA